MHRFLIWSSFILFFLTLLSPAPARGCACGCGMFDVQEPMELPAQTAAQLPARPGGMVALEYDFINQNRDWNGASRGSDGNNGDKILRTHFVTAEAQYMVSRQWGFSGEVPVWNRYFLTSDNNGNLVSYNHTALGDIRLRAIYTGISDDMSSGLTFGTKLPTGDYTSPGYDRDSEIGTGSTDLLVGAFHRGAVSDDQDWQWFVNAVWDQPVLMAAQYRPGAEFNGLAGASYGGLKFSGMTLTPLAQLVESIRMRDSGTFASAPASGYARLLGVPGLVLDASKLRFTASVGLPIAQFFNGDQLVAGEYFKFSVGCGF